MSSTYIQSLIDEITASQATKLASDHEKDEKHEKSDKKDDKSDKKDRGREFFEKMRGKKDDEKKAAVKTAAERAAFDLFAEVADLPDDLRKLAAMEAEAEFFADLQRQQAFGFGGAAKQASDDEYAALFNEVFEAHTAKLASFDPDYAVMLAEEQQKMAFNQGFEDAMAELQAQINPLSQF
jgi:hypothetical protein